jgi:hypothetical protein
MRNPRLTVFCILLAIAVCVPATAQTDSSQEDPPTKPQQIGATDRLFLSFAEEATLVDRQWWEGQAEIQDGSGFDAKILRGVAAFQPWAQVEFGGRVGFGDTSLPGTLVDGSGATDLDVWAKYHFGTGGKTEFAGGGLARVPTGDDAAGLGFDSFAFGAFGSLRHQGERFVFTGNLGINGNGDGRIFGVPLNGETSFTAGAGVLIPTNRRLTFVGEARFESERFSGFDSDTRLLGGINLGVGEGGVFRAAIAFGLTDGAPDGQLIAGYAATF